MAPSQTASFGAASSPRRFRSRSSSRQLRVLSRKPSIRPGTSLLPHSSAPIMAARDLDLAESVLRRWMRELTATPAAAFPGNGQMRADLAEISALKKAAARLRAERDILKKGEPSAPSVQAQWRALFFASEVI